MIADGGRLIIRWVNELSMSGSRTEGLNTY